MKIGILETGHVPEGLADKHGTYPEMFERLLQGRGLTFETYTVVDGQFPKSVHECDGWLITGSRHGAYEPHAWIPPLEEFIRKAYGAGVPLVGICFGHQIMAQALGGKVEKFAGGWGVGPVEYKARNGASYELHAMHQDQVVEKPPEAEVTASSEHCEFAAFAYKGKAISFQPHPEFSAGYMRDLIEARKGKAIPLDRAEAALARTGRQTDEASIGAEIVEFFRQSARRAA